MKKVFLIISFLLVVHGAFSQDNKPADAKSEKEIKKEKIKAQEDITRLSVKNMVTMHRFHLEVTQMSDQSQAFGQSSGLVDVSAQNNYFAVDSDNVVLSLEPSTYLKTNWGIDNAISRGKLFQYEVSVARNAENGYFIKFRTSGHIGNLSATMKVTPLGKTELKLSKLDGQTLTFAGILKPYNEPDLSSARH